MENINGRQWNFSHFSFSDFKFPLGEGFKSKKWKRVRSFINSQNVLIHHEWNAKKVLPIWWLKCGKYETILSNWNLLLCFLFCRSEWRKGKTKIRIKLIPTVCFVFVAVASWLKWTDISHLVYLSCPSRERCTINQKINFRNEK